MRVTEPDHPSARQSRPQLRSTLGSQSVLDPVPVRQTARMRVPGGADVRFAEVWIIQGLKRSRPGECVALGVPVPHDQPPPGPVPSPLDRGASVRWVTRTNGRTGDLTGIGFRRSLHRFAKMLSQASKASGKVEPVWSMLAVDLAKKCLAGVELERDGPAIGEQTPTEGGANRAPPAAGTRWSVPP
jgi:hypothetical protein